MQDHVHIQLTTGESESGKYHIRHGSLDATPLVPATIDRALNLTLHLHAVLDNSGNPRVLSNYSFQILFASSSDIASLVALAGREAYFIPNDHPADGDPTNHALARQPVVVMIKSGSVTNMDAGLQYWTAGVELVAR